MAAPDLTDREWAMLAHQIGHITAKFQGWEAALVGDCWGYPLDDVPDWAIKAAEAGEVAATWCPIVNPQLSDGPR